MEPECLDSSVALPGISCLFLDRVPELSVFCFLHLQNVGNISAYLIGLCEG